LNSAPLLECQDIAFTRDDYPLFSGLNFQLFAGQALQVRGANGAGKTTLLRILATSLSLSEGNLLWQGKPVQQCLQAYRCDLLYLGHLPGIKNALTPLENLNWYCQVNPVKHRDISGALSRVGLAGYEDVPCQTLSAGQLRRVALARLYITSASLWILDEPFTAIDSKGVAQLEQDIDQHLSAGGAVVLTSHQQPQLAELHKMELEAFSG
jgi:heme exporter protein A